MKKPSTEQLDKLAQDAWRAGARHHYLHAPRDQDELKDQLKSAASGDLSAAYSILTSVIEGFGDAAARRGARIIAAQWYKQLRRVVPERVGPRVHRLVQRTALERRNDDLRRVARRARASYEADVAAGKRRNLMKARADAVRRMLELGDALEFEKDVDRLEEDGCRRVLNEAWPRARRS